MVNRQVATGVLLALLGCAVWAQSPGNSDDETPGNILFRYKDSKGNWVVEQSIPPAAAANGYEIITENGRVLKKVPKALTGEDAVKYAERLRLEAELAEWDARLKRRYSSVKDIESAKKRALAELSGNLAILRANLSNVTSQLEEQQRQAGIRERNGQAIPQRILDNIHHLKAEKAEVRRQIAAREEELARKAADFDKDIERFRVILAEGQKKTGQ